MNSITKTMTIHPIAGSMGAEIYGVDLSQPLSEDQMEAIRQALWTHKAIFFRDQDLTPEQHIAFGQRFGPAHEDLFIKGHDDYPELMELLVKPDHSGYNFGGEWHSDVSYLEKPSMGVVLYGRELPPYGGDTAWTNMELVYERLSDPYKAMLEGLRADHVAYGLRQKLKIRKGDYAIAFKDADEVTIEGSHPVVRTHDQTGKKCLFVNPAYTLRFTGMSEEESAPILNYLYQFAIRPAFTCRFRWEPGSLAVWDNRNTMHFAIGDYFGHKRLMHRYTIQGEKPL